MDDIETVAADARAGDESAFGALVARLRPELRLHCYRLLGSMSDADDAVQDALLQAWRAIGGFEGRSSVRTWLYRIATNTCLAKRTKDRRRRDLLAATALSEGVAVPLPMTVPWLEACPDEILDQVAASVPDAAQRLVARETIELHFIAALQHLTGPQRAAVVLRDVLGWSAAECAAELDITMAAANGAVRRGRARLRDLLGPDRQTWAVPGSGSVDPGLIRRYVDAVEGGDQAAIAALLSEDAVVGHQPWAGQPTAEVGWYAGRQTIVEAWAPAFPLELRLVEVRVNRQPAVASYARLPGTAEHRAFALTVLTLDASGLITEVTNLKPDQLALVGLPQTLPATNEGK